MIWEVEKVLCVTQFNIHRQSLFKREYWDAQSCLHWVLNTFYLHYKPSLLALKLN